MRIFHIVILAYSFVAMGCGFKTTPVWRDAPKQEPKQESKQEKQDSIKKQ